MTRLKVHNMAEGGTAQADISTLTGVPVRSIQRIVAESAPTREEVIAGVQASRPPIGRPRKADDAMVERIRLLLADPRNANIAAMEVLRRARLWGFRGGRSQMAELVKQLRPKLQKEPVVLFDGMPGEYAQFDFGQVEVRFTAAGVERIRFFGGRLKYSRYMHVVLVHDETSETVARSLLLCLSAFGGSTKEWVFDNPRTIRVSRIGVVPIELHRFIAQLVSEYNVIATFCAPRSGNQKGSVERLVGFVKNSFFRQRLFRDRVDLEAQLAEWLHEVNHVRPCDATGEIPGVRRIHPPNPIPSHRPGSRETGHRCCAVPASAYTLAWPSWAIRQFIGVSSWMRLTGCSWIRESTSARYTQGSIPCIAQLSISVNIVAPA